ncbi:MAG TPA: LytTR family DNA-binding domain-containing protein [Flavobacterium sp.]|nr:LytTR family DNA-binding domain-containing protein [Flavobacterium sp.]
MTKPITAILVDDEADNRELLANLLQTYFPEIDLQGTAASVEEAHKLVLKTNPQLVFLDIQMPRANGFNLLKKFDPVPFEVIFVTSYDQYAINAIKFNALDYILKPIEIENLQESIKRAVAKIGQNERNSLQIVNLLYSLENESNKRIAVHVSDKVKILNASDVIYIEADGRYCTIVNQDGQKFSTAKILKDFEDYFGQDSSFIRINKSFMANTSFIKNYSKGEPFMVEMVNGTVFEVPRRKKVEILQKLFRQ